MCRWRRRELCRRRVAGSCRRRGAVWWAIRSHDLSNGDGGSVHGGYVVRSAFGAGCCVATGRCAGKGDVSRKATWSCNCWVGRFGRGCCFEVLDYGGLGWEYVSAGPSFHAVPRSGDSHGPSLT